jgi:uncharacterized protein (TIGR00725 family)
MSAHRHRKKIHMRATDLQPKKFRDKKIIAVCCGATPPPEEVKLAYEVGAEIARRSAILVCGGLGGSMEAACRGAKENDGLTIGILPTYEKDSANPWVDIIIPTGLGHARNNLVVATANGVIGVGGGWGTLSELAIASRIGKVVVVLNGWDVIKAGEVAGGFLKAESAEEAVRIALGEEKRGLNIEAG